MSEPNLNDILGGGGLSSLLQNPDIAAKLPKIMEALAPVMDEMKKERTEEEVTEEAGSSAEEKAKETLKEEAVLSAFKKHSKGNTRRSALLKALTPYLSDSRKEAMGYIMKVTTLIDILSEVM